MSPSGEMNVVKQCADPSIATPYGYTALHRAAGHGNVEVVQLLLDAGADLSARDENGYTAHDMALHEAQFDAAVLIARRRIEQSRKEGHSRIMLEDAYAAIMMFAPHSSEDYHLVSVEFEDGTQLPDAKVFDKCELELPPEYVGKKIKTLGLRIHQP